MAEFLTDISSRERRPLLAPTSIRQDRERKAKMPPTRFRRTVSAILHHAGGIPKMEVSMTLIAIAYPAGWCLKCALIANCDRPFGVYDPTMAVTD
jgi:hypothetical protein